LWPIIGDKTQVHQILLNLCINARDAMSRGGRLAMRAENVMVDEEFAVRHSPMRAGPYVKLEVADTGHGIPAANLEKIFDPFFTTKEFGKGTGLGLSTVLGIVKSHHGLVTVESVVNKGTTFKVLLPASPLAAKGSAPGKLEELARGNGETILLVDDEANIVAAARRMLEQHGYKTLVAANGNEALAIFARGEPAVDVVVTDIMMPAMDGLELIRALRRIDPDARIVASSGLGKELANRLRAVELKELRVHSFLAKPYAAESLLAVLQAVLRERAEAPKAEPEMAQV
jgi:CheY-like chemotaxis protein